MASLITATVVKEDQSSKLGIAFEREGEGKALKIKLIRDDSLFAGSALLPGLVVVSAAGQDMLGKTPKDAAEAMRGAPGGQEIDLVCKGTITTIAKPKLEKTKSGKRLSFRKKPKEAPAAGPPPKLGISFKSTSAHPGKVYVSKINDDSKFAGTALDVGHLVVGINGEPCPATVSEAVQLLKKEDVTEITIITVDPADEVAPILEKTEKGAEPEGDAAAPGAEDPVEEKKEEFPEDQTSDRGAMEDEEDTTPEGNKPLLDSMFAWCIC